MADPLVGAFIDRYLERAGPEHRPAVLAYTSLTLLRLVQIAWAKPERRLAARPLLELCEERCGARRPTAARDAIARRVAPRGAV